MCWGKNTFGSLGDNTTTGRSVATKVLGINNAIKAHTGNDFTCFLLQNGTIFCTGKNDYGNLGNGMSASVRLPVKIEDLNEIMAGARGEKKIKAKNKLADKIRTDLTELRNELANWPDDGSTRTFSWTEVKADGTVVRHENEALTKQQAQALMANLEEQLASVKEMSELAKFDLQKNLQDYQQALQTFSAILKDAHDQMMRTIQNLKA